jgi:hypothetical protein
MDVFTGGLLDGMGLPDMMTMAADRPCFLVMQGNRDGYHDDRLAECWQDIVAQSIGRKSLPVVSLRG